MTKQRAAIWMILYGAGAVALLGCSEEKTERMLNQETYSFVGVFENHYNSDLLEFKDAQVTFITSQGLDFTKPFEVDDDHLTIQMRNSSKEKREDIVMRIHGQSELLTCNVCAKYDMASIWLKKNFVPPAAPLNE